MYGLAADRAVSTTVSNTSVILTRYSAWIRRCYTGGCPHESQCMFKYWPFLCSQRRGRGHIRCSYSSHNESRSTNIFPCVSLSLTRPICFPDKKSSVNITFSYSDLNQRNLLSFLIDNSLAYAETGWGGYINVGNFSTIRSLSHSTSPAKVSFMSILWWIYHKHRQPWRHSEIL